MDQEIPKLFGTSGIRGKIAEEITFKHYTVEKGYFEVRINNKLYDTKVFIK